MNGGSIHNYMLYHNEGLKYFNFDIELLHGSSSLDDITSYNIAALGVDASQLIKQENTKLNKVVEIIK